MPVIKTETNRVIADEPEADDLFVRLTWHGPGDGKYLKGFDGPIQMIDQYDATVAWAVELADQMRFPIYVEPLRARDVFEPKQVLTALPHLTDQERDKLRAYVVRAMAELMRDCSDPQVRADAYQVLEQLGVVEQ